MRTSLIILFSTLTFIGCEKKENKHDDRLSVFVCADNPPFLSLSEEGELCGFEKEILDLIEKDMKQEIIYEFVSDFSGLIASILSFPGKGFAISAISITETRKRSILFTKPYYKSCIALIFNKSSTSKCLGAQIGTLMSNYIHIVVKENEGSAACLYDSVSSLLAALESDEIGACYLDAISAGEYMARLSPDNREKYCIVLIKDASFDYAIALNLKDTVLCQRINEIIEKNADCINKIIKKSIKYMDMIEENNEEVYQMAKERGFIARECHDFVKIELMD